jgi:Domain of unknown function (DUF4352)
MKIMNVMVSMAVAGAVLTGCAVEEPVAKVGESQSKAGQAQSVEKKTQVFKVGDVVKVGEAQLTISEAKFVKAEAFNEPKNGKVLALKVEGENKGADTYVLTNFDFNLYDTDGNKLAEYLSTEHPPLQGEINAGKKSSGYVTFDVKEADKYELVYKPNMFTNQEIKFEIVPQK